MASAGSEGWESSECSSPRCAVDWPGFAHSRLECPSGCVFCGDEDHVGRFCEETESCPDFDTDGRHRLRCLRLHATQPMEGEPGRPGLETPLETPVSSSVGRRTSESPEAESSDSSGPAVEVVRAAGWEDLVVPLKPRILDFIKGPVASELCRLYPELAWDFRKVDGEASVRIRGPKAQLDPARMELLAQANKTRKNPLYFSNYCCFCKSEHHRGFECRTVLPCEAFDAQGCHVKDCLELHWRGSGKTAKVVLVPRRLHSLIIGADGANRKRLFGERVFISFPLAGSDDEEVLVFGKIAPVERAILILQELCRRDDRGQSLTSAVQEILLGHWSPEELPPALTPPQSTASASSSAAQSPPPKARPPPSLMDLPSPSLTSSAASTPSSAPTAPTASAASGRLVTLDVSVPQRFHEAISGGKRVMKWDSVELTFPYNNNRSDRIKVRGRAAEAERAVTELRVRGLRMGEEEGDVFVSLRSDSELGGVIGRGGGRATAFRRAHPKVDLSIQGESLRIRLRGQPEHVEPCRRHLLAFLKRPGAYGEDSRIPDVPGDQPTAPKSQGEADGEEELWDLSPVASPRKAPPSASSSLADSPFKVPGNAAKPVTPPKSRSSLDRSRRSSRRPHEVWWEPDMAGAQLVSCREDLFGYLIGPGGIRIRKFEEKHPAVLVDFLRDGENQIRLFSASERSLEAAAAAMRAMVEAAERDESVYRKEPAGHDHDGPEDDDWGQPAFGEDSAWEGRQELGLRSTASGFQGGYFGGEAREARPAAARPVVFAGAFGCPSDDEE